MATMKDVAAAAGVSIATVSAVVNGTTKVSAELTERVQSAIEKVGYRPNDVARSLRKGHTQTIAFILPGITNPIFAEIAQTIESIANSEGYAVFVCNALEDSKLQRKYIQFARSMRVAGAIVIPSLNEHFDAKSIREELGAPVVVLDRASPNLDVDTVAVDNEDAAERAVKYLISLGHKRIAAISSVETSFTTIARVGGYKKAMASAGISTEGLIKYNCSSIERAKAATFELMSSSERPTAIFATYEHSGMGAVQALNQLELRFPEDVSFITFDGNAWADALNPRVTTIRQPSERMGTEAVRLLLERIEEKNPTPFRRLILPTEFLLKESCSHPKLTL